MPAGKNHFNKFNLGVDAESGHNYSKDGQLSGQPIHGVFKNLFSINLFFVIGFPQMFWCFMIYIYMLIRFVKSQMPNFKRTNYSTKASKK